jgi:hypothetical protein
MGKRKGGWQRFSNLEGIKTHTVTWPLTKEGASTFRSYLTKLGAVVYSWNQLQETLAKLFWVVTDIPKGDMPLGVWHSTQNDRAQRSMLRAAIIGQTSKEFFQERDPIRVKEDILWLLAEVDKLSEARNNALHASYHFVVQPLPRKMAADTIFRNPRAAKLENRELKAEFDWCEQTANELAHFASFISFSLETSLGTWPERPSLPNRGQKKSPKPRRQARQPKPK